MANDYGFVHQLRKAITDQPIDSAMQYVQNRTKQDAATMASDAAEKENAKWQRPAPVT